MCRDVLSALFRCGCTAKLHFHARAKTLRHMAREKCKQVFKNVQHLMRTNIAAFSISFDSLVNKAASTCCVVHSACMRSDSLQRFELARGS